MKKIYKFNGVLYCTGKVCIDYKVKCKSCSDWCYLDEFKKVKSKNGYFKLSYICRNCINFKARENRLPTAKRESKIVIDGNQYIWCSKCNKYLEEWLFNKGDRYCKIHRKEYMKARYYSGYGEMLCKKRKEKRKRINTFIGSWRKLNRLVFK